MIQQLSEDLVWSQIVARAWCDKGVMQRLFSNPRAVFTEHNLVVPEGTEIKVLEGTEAKVVNDTNTVRHYILPGKPPDELEEEDLVGSPVAWCAACGCRACRGCAGCGACGRCGCRCWW
jgi:hypothetical protein